MMLGLTDIECRPDQKTGLVTGAAGNYFRAQGIGTQQPCRTMLFCRSDGDQD